MIHSNNPISGDNFFDGTLGVRFFGSTFTFPWQLWETPNSPQLQDCALSGSQSRCDDQVAFSDTTSNTTVTIEGVEYQLNLRGFIKAGTGPIQGTPPGCPAFNAGAVTDTFQTLESTTTYACLYAELDEPGSINVIKDATPSSIAEPGGLVTFDVEVQNTSDDDAVNITSLSDDVHGNLNGQGDCSVPQSIAAGDSYTCSFTANVTGNPGYVETDVVTASGTDDDGNPVSDDDDATVTISDTPSSIEVTKTANPTEVAEPGGSVEFTVRVDNTSSVDSVTIDSLDDSIHGDLDGQGDCSCPQTIPAGGHYECTLQRPRHRQPRRR